MRYYEILFLLLIFVNSVCNTKRMKLNYPKNIFKINFYTYLSNQFSDFTKLTMSKRFRNSDINVVDEHDYHNHNKDNIWFENFVSNRNWYYCESFWSRTIKSSSYTTLLPSYILGDNIYGVTNLVEVNKAGLKGEFTSKNFKYSHRQTFALRIGYDGNYYYGYQKQTNCPGKTVEGDLHDVLKCSTIGAGRTDRGVSAISQVICFNTNNMNMTAQYVYDKLKSSIPCQEGRLAIYDCQRVPKKFHSRASATWRRYLYLFPLRRKIELKDNDSSISSIHKDDNNVVISNNNYDVDIEVLNSILSKIENIDLPYNAFAFKEDRNQGEGLNDRCTIFKAKATIINLADSAVSKEPWPIQSIPTSNEVDVGNENMLTQQTVIASDDNDIHEDEEDENEEDVVPVIDGYVNSKRYPGYRITKYTHEKLDEDDLPAICIELVGSRFLRRMVRILTATSIREAIKNKEERNDNILVDICLSGDRKKTARPLPGPPLCLAGVGYDIDDLAIYKFMPKVDYNQLMNERNKVNNNLIDLNICKSINNL